MNKNATIAVVIIAVAAIGAVTYFSYKKTPPVVVYDNNTTTNPQPQTSTPAPAPVAAVNKAGLPIVVTSSASFPTDTSVVVNGTINPNGAATNYWYEYGPSQNLGGKTSVSVVGSGYGVIGAPNYITGLLKNTVYYYRLVAENKYGRVMGAQYSFQTLQSNPAPIVGSAPSVQTSAASNISRTMATLKGQIKPNKVETQYWFEYGRSSDLGNTTAVVSAGTGSVFVPVSISVSDLEPLTKYYYRLNAQNQFGTINGSVLSFNTQGPANPSSPVATTKNASSISSSGAQLNAIVDPNGDATSYWFEYSSDSLLGSVLLSSTSQKSVNGDRNETSVNTDINDLASNRTYYFRIVAQNSVGTSRGQIISFKTK